MRTRTESSGARRFLRARPTGGFEMSTGSEPSGSIVGDDSVTRSAHGVQHALIEVVVDLASQVPDVDLDDVAITFELGAPHLVEQVVLWRHRAAAAHERLEQRELAAGELDVLAGAAAR